MPLRESEAIILRCYPLGEGDRLVSFLSRTQGRMRGVARGARRPKSRFGSTLEPLSYVRIWFFEKETRELVHINQCELIESALSLQSDYRTGLTLALCSEITEAVLPEREASDPAFRLLLMVVRNLREAKDPQLVLLYFALWSVRLGGWLPSLEKCSLCGRVLAGERAFVSISRPGVSCSRCQLPGMRSVDDQSMVLARTMLETRLDNLQPVAGDTKQFAAMQKYLLDLIEHQIERKLTSRELLESA